VTPEGRSYPPGQYPQATPQQITPGYLSTMGIPLLAGREFTTADRAESMPVVIVSKRLAEMFWPNENPVGRRMKVSAQSLPFMTVVGVVGDFRSRGFDDTPEPTFYVPYDQTGVSGYYQPPALSIVLRTRGEPALLASSLRDAVRALDRTVPVSNIRTMEQILGTSVANRRFSTMLLAGFATLALVLAGIGTYGVISYGVTQRSFEIGVRMALGAGERSVLVLVMSEGLRMSVIGLGVGLVASIGLGRGIRALLVGVPIVDAPTLLVASAALLAVALVACIIPARRAMTVSPVAVMRGDG
jgi:putative ABC transport system permease protein